MSESHSSATATGPLTGHRVRFDGRDALCGSLENGMYRIRFERTGHSLLVTPSRAIEDLGPANLYIDQPAPKPKLETIDRLCQGSDHGEEEVGVIVPVSVPRELVRCATCKSAAGRRHVEAIEKAEAKRKAERKARRIAKDKRQPRTDRSAFSKTYGPLSNW